jgi:small-conductance mechanosensitive channel
LIVVTSLALIAVFVSVRVVRKAILAFCERSHLEKHVENLLILFSRIVLYSIGITFILGAWGFPTEWFISVSALSGAAVGFASTQTIGNFLAGLYIMTTRPFSVNDYVKIGSTEGEVREITMNYVKIYTPTYTITEIPNKVVLDSTIQRLMEGDMVDYSFPLSFAEKIWASAWVSSSTLFETILEPAIEEFWEAHREELPRKPETSVLSIGRMDRTVMVRTFFPKGNAQLLYDLQPELLKLILRRLDAYRIERDAEK